MMTLPQIMRLIEKCEGKTGTELELRLFSDGSGSVVDEDNDTTHEFDDIEELELVLKEIIKNG